jgi:hypothetical protein
MNSLVVFLPNDRLVNRTCFCIVHRACTRRDYLASLFHGCMQASNTRIFVHESIRIRLNKQNNLSKEKELIMKKTSKNISIGLISIAMLGTGFSVLAEGETATPAAKIPTPAVADKDSHVKNSASQELAKRRQQLAKEAIIANDEILHSIFYLKKNNTRDAYKMLEKADGQLNILLARDPHLKLAPIGVRASISDLEASPQTIKKAVKDAESDLDKGKIQTARLMLSPLVSEMHIETDFVPLEIYPHAIKQASREIQESKIKAAEATLADAMSSIVTNDEIIPLPPLKAEGDMIEAEQLLNKDKVKNKDAVLALLKSADTNLANADALGYGKHPDIKKEIASIKSKVEGGASNPGLFARVRNMFHKITPSS